MTLSRQSRSIVLLCILLGPSCGKGGGGGGNSGGGTGLPPLASDIPLDSEVAISGQYLETACVGDAVYVAWIDVRSSFTEVYFNRSVDAGASWLPTSVRVNHGVPGSAVRGGVKLGVTGSSVYIAWGDKRNGAWDVYFNRSLDGGMTWLASDVRVDTDASVNNSYLRDMAVEGARVHIAYEDTRGGGHPVYYNRSTDSGATWLASDLVLDHNLVNGSCTLFRIACSGAYVYVVWTDRRNNPSTDEIFLNSSSDYGATWRSSDVRVATNAAGTVVSWAPTLGCSGARVYVAWQDLISGKEDIQFNSSQDGGTTWQAAQHRLVTQGVAGTWVARRPSMAVEGQTIVVVWEDTRNDLSSTGIIDVYSNRSLDGGLTWLPSDRRVDTDVPQADSSFSPLVSLSGTQVGCVWQDSRNASLDIYFAGSSDAGATWTSDRRIDTDVGGSGFSDLPRISGDGSRVYSIWPDYRSGTMRIYFNRPLP